MRLRRRCRFTITAFRHELRNGCPVGEPQHCGVQQRRCWRHGEANRHDHELRNQQRERHGNNSERDNVRCQRDYIALYSGGRIEYDIHGGIHAHRSRRRDGYTFDYRYKRKFRPHLHSRLEWNRDSGTHRPEPCVSEFRERHHGPEQLATRDDFERGEWRADGLLVRDEGRRVQRHRTHDTADGTAG